MFQLARWLKTDRQRNPPPEPPPETPIGALTTPEQMGRLFADLAAQHQLVSVFLPGTERGYTSAILGVRQDRRILYLDELSPHSGHAQLEQGQRIRVSARREGVDYHFETSLNTIDSTGSIATYTLSFPQRIRLHQRRNAFRAEVELSKRIPVYLESSDGSLIPGELRDISVDGIGVDLLKRPLTRYSKGQRVETCRIHIPGEDPVDTSIEVCFVGRIGRSSHLRLGGRFAALSPTAGRSIRRLVARLDRTRLKHERSL